MSIHLDPFSTSAPGRIRVGGYVARGARTPTYAGPSGSMDWEQQTVGTRHRFYQETVADLVLTAHIRANGHRIRVCSATMEELQLYDATLALVPPSHLALLLERKPEGFMTSSTTGRGSSLSYTGGLNARVDNPDTLLFDESRGITITHGALWNNRALGICPTILHEIGHVMTHRGEISYRSFPPDRASALAGTRASRNPGRLEALCNAYMYFLCYGAENGDIRSYGTGTGIQNDRVTREALRETRAFSSMLDGDWTARFEER